MLVDYLQLMSAVPIGGKRFENRTQEVSAISRGLKAVAKELRVPVVALSQLSRAPESRGGDHRPQLSDLRESGSIEQDADVVAFIFREEVYKKNDPDLEGLAEIIVAKQRNGPTGTIKLAFLHSCTRFENRASENDYIE
jgi:replicative DNA helicase